MAVHGSNFDALGVPYMIPGENGARGGLEWLQLHNCARRERRNTGRRTNDDTRSRASSEYGGTGSSPSPSPITVSESNFASVDENQQSDFSAKNNSNSDAILGDDNVTRQGLLPNRELVVRCSRPFSFSVLPCTTEELSNASNTADVLQYQRESKKACVNIDPYIMGIGGDDTW